MAGLPKARSKVWQLLYVLFVCRAGFQDAVLRDAVKDEGMGAHLVPFGRLQNECMKKFTFWVVIHKKKVTFGIMSLSSGLDVGKV